MKWIKFILLIGIVFLSVYAVSTLFVDSSNNTYKVENEIDFPIDQVYSQFENLQNIPQWESFFVENKDVVYTYFAPYEGEGASMSFQRKDAESGDIIIKKEKKLKEILYHLQTSEDSYPYIYKVKFQYLAPDKTKIVWEVTTPQRSLLEQTLNIDFSRDEDIVKNINQSMKNLNNLLGNKIHKEVELATIKYDSIMVQDQTEKLLLGITDSETNLGKNEKLLNDIVRNHNKILVYLTNDLEKKTDEFGDPVLITRPSSLKDNINSYFYGFSVAKKQNISSNYSFKKTASGKKYVMYYKGSYVGRNKSVDALIQRIRQDSLRSGYLEETFLEKPEAGKDVNLKLSIPVFK